VQIIHNWLNGKQNFIVGTSLYKAFGKDEKLKHLFAQGESGIAKKLLAEELKKLIEPGKPVITIAPKPVVRETDVMPEGNTPVLEALKNEWQHPYQRMNLLRHQLDKYGNKNTKDAIAYRKPIAREIKELEQQCMAIWAKRDYYEKEGKLPFVAETKMVIPTDPIELAELISNLKKNIRRNRKLMADNADKPQYAQFYVEYKNQYKQLTGRDYAEKN